MKLIGLMPVRNEAWILGLSARVALSWVDEMVFLDHASTDATGSILARLAGEYPGRVHILTEPDGAWREMAHRQRTLDTGRELGGTHFAIIDADEILTGDALGHVRGYVERLAPGQYLHTNMYAMWRSPYEYRNDASVWSRRRDLVLAFADRPDLCWSAQNGYDHHQRAPRGTFQCGVMASGGVMHMQFASWRRLVAKHDFYQMMERVKYPAKSIREIAHMYSLATDERGLRCSPAPTGWWLHYAAWEGYLDLDHEPWHEQGCREMWQQYGAEYFRGLNLNASWKVSNSAYAQA